MVTRRVSRCGRARRLRVRGRSDFGGCVLHRRQRRDERRRQEGGAVGHGGRQSRLVAHGRSGRQLARSHAPRSQPRQDPRSCRRDLRADLEGRTRSRPRTAQALRTAAHRRSKAASSARSASARTSPTSSSAACPACRRKAATGSSPRRAGCCIGCRSTSAPCAWSSSVTRGRDSVDRRDQDYLVARGAAERRQGRHRAARRPRAPRRALSARGRLRDQIASAARCRRWC